MQRTRSAELNCRWLDAVACGGFSLVVCANPAGAHIIVARAATRMILMVLSPVEADRSYEPPWPGECMVSAAGGGIREPRGAIALSQATWITTLAVPVYTHRLAPCGGSEMRSRILAVGISTASGIKPVRPAAYFSLFDVKEYGV